MSDTVSVARSGMRVMWRAVRPERWKLSVAAGCGLVAWSGFTASWVFTDGMGPPKPPLYEVVWPLGLIAWALTVMLMYPLLAVTGPVLNATGLNLMDVQAPHGIAVVGLYL